MAKHGFKHTKISHHKDGSLTVHHVHKDGPHKDVHHAVMSLDHLHDSMQDHLGTPNEGEMEAAAGNHGIPAEHAQSAGIPMPAAQGQAA